MDSIQTKQDLQNAILHLEQRQIQEKTAMQKYYQESYDYMKPVNLLKTAISEITHADELKMDMLKAAIALAIGYLANKIVERYIIKERTPLSLAIETILQIIITGTVARNGTVIKDIILYFFKTILRHKQQQLISSSAD